MTEFRPKDINLFLGIGKLYKQVKKVAGVKESKKPKDKKNIILFVGALYGHMIDAVREFEKAHDERFRIAVIYDTKEGLDTITARHQDRIDIMIDCDTYSPAAIQQALIPYQHELVAATCRPEKFVPMLQRIIPNIPYVKTPTVESMEWSTDKILMRKRLATFDPSINPKFAVIKDQTKKSIKSAIEKVGFPLIVKPSGLAASRLVSICYHEEELKSVLKKVFKSMDGVVKENGGTYEQRVLLEQYMEGQTYSMDAYVSQYGRIFFTPMCYIRTGRDIGFDDFFGYSQITPTQLKKESIDEAQVIAAKAIYGMSLRSTTVHVELLRLEEGWKIIEMGPRMGGFRHMMYEHSFHMNHVMNDILIRRGKKPIIPKKLQGYTVAMKFFAKEEGKLKAINGIKKVQDLASFKRIYINKRVGDTCLYAKHGGSSVFNIILFNKDRSALLADMRRLETTINIQTTKK